MALVLKGYLVFNDLTQETDIYKGGVLWGKMVWDEALEKTIIYKL